MRAPVVYLLDTNILVHLVRASRLGEAVAARYQLFDHPFKPLISVVTVGEALKLGKELNWGDKKIAKLRGLLRQLTWVDINHDDVFAAYADIAHLSDTSGQTKGQNDYWIAATAKATSATLLTTDRDFDHLHGVHIQREYIDPRDQPR